MKKIIGILSLVLVIGFTSNAQQNNKRVHRNSELSPEQIAILKTKKMDLQLDLSEQQEKAVYKLLEAASIDRKNTREKYRSAKEKGEKLTSDERFEHQNSRLDKQLEHKAAMKKILSDEQFIKWEETTKNRMKAYKKRSARTKNNSKKRNSKGFGNNDPQNRQFNNKL